MFDRCASPNVQLFFEVLKENLVVKMKKLKHLKRNVMTNKNCKEQKCLKLTPMSKVDGSDARTAELISKIKTMYNMTYSEETRLRCAKRHSKPQELKKKKRKRWSLGIIRTKMKKKKKQAQEVKLGKSDDRAQGTSPNYMKHEVIELDDIEDHDADDQPDDFVDLVSLESEDEIYEKGKLQEIRDKTESVFNSYKVVHLDKERKMSYMTTMNKAYQDMKKKNSYSLVSTLLNKLDMSSSTYDYSLNEIGLLHTDDLLQRNDDLQTKIFYNHESIPSGVHGKVPFCTVGPLQVRRYEDEVVFYCTLDGCKNWCTTKPSYLHRHIQAKHSELTFDWSCSLCPIIDMTFIKTSDLCDLEWAFKHLMVFHIERRNYGLYLLEKYQDKNDSYIPGVNDEDKTEIKIDSVITLNPSFKQDKYNLHKNSRVPKLFVCPISNCEFTSDCEMASFKHFFNEFDELEYHKCTYCELSFKEAFSYCGHILDEHGFDKYQCTYCMYRSISKNNVVHHQMDQHTSNSIRILSNKDKKHFKNKRKESDISVDLVPYKCTKKNCNFQTNISKFFSDHLTRSHVNMSYTCQHPNCSFKTNIPHTLIEHMPSHAIAEFQCKYCPYASNNPQAIRRHMYQTHASKHPYCFQRIPFISESEKISKQYSNISSLSTNVEDVVLIDLDSCVAENLWDHEVINAEEYERSLNSYDCNVLVEQETCKEDVEDDKTEGYEKIVLSDSEHEDTPQVKNKTLRISNSNPESSTPNHNSLLTLVDTENTETRNASANNAKLPILMNVNCITQQKMVEKKTLLFIPTMSEPSLSSPSLSSPTTFSSVSDESNSSVLSRLTLQNKDAASSTSASTISSYTNGIPQNNPSNGESNSKQAPSTSKKIVKVPKRKSDLTSSLSDTSKSIHQNNLRNVAKKSTTKNGLF